MRFVIARKNIRCSSKYFFFREGQNLLMKRNSEKKQSYLWQEELIGVVEEEASYYSYNDELGSPLMILDLNGMLRESYSYGVYGEENKEERFQPFGFTGYQRAGNLSYANARYYDAENGRFVSEDKHTGYLENPMSLHKYLYCYQNPLGFVDLDGNVPTKSQVLFPDTVLKETPPNFAYYNYNPDAKRGTITLKIAANANVLFGVAYDADLSVDRHGNIAVQLSESLAYSERNNIVNVGGIDAGVGMQLQYTNAKTVFDLEGTAEYIGYSGNAPGFLKLAGGYVGIDLVDFPEANLKNELGVNGYQLQIGRGIGSDVHNSKSYTETFLTINPIKLLKKLKDIIGEKIKKCEE